MRNFLDTISHLDKNNDFAGLLMFVQEKQRDPNELFFAILQLLPKKRLHSAYILAMLLGNVGFRHVVVSFARSAGGLHYGNPLEEAQGLEDLWTQAEALPADQQTHIYNQIIIPVMAFLLDAPIRDSVIRQLLRNGLEKVQTQAETLSTGRAGTYEQTVMPMITHMLKVPLKNPETERILRILEILKAAVPRFRTIFDWNARIPGLSSEEIGRQGRAQARIVLYPSPPPGAPRQKRRAVVAMRHTFFLSSKSRLVEIGPRMVAAMHTYGWQATYYGMNQDNSREECQAIVETCRQQNAEILILDDELLIGIKQARAEMIAQLRRNHPSLKIVGCMLDAWSKEADVLTETSALLDMVWDATSPSLPLWKNPVFSHKVLNMPLTYGVYGEPNQPLIPQMLFAGSINLYNWHRAFWLAAADRMDLPIIQKLSTHQKDDLPVLTSYERHRMELTQATCCLNLTMRSEQTCTVVGRSFEVPLSGALLVQESSPNMHHFFVAGEHYLEFSTLAELSAIARFIRADPEKAEEIRRRGSTFARERYSDEKLIGYIDKFFYFPD